MERLVQAARTLLVGTARGFDRARAFFMSVAAGTLRLRQLRAGVEHTWRDYLEDEAQIDAGLDPAEAAVVARFIGAADRVLVIGCGAGRDLIPLARMGCDVVGIDPIAETVATARRALETRQLRGSVIAGYFEETDIPGCFDVILFSNHCYSYIPERRRRVAVLGKAARQLTGAGRILVTYIASTSAPRKRSLRVMQTVARLTRSDWQPEPGDQLDSLEAPRGFFGYEHLFVAGELEQEAADAGLHVLPHREHPHVRQMLVLQKV